MESNHNNYYANLNRLMRFFQRMQAGYAFACLKDLRQLSTNNKQIEELLIKNGQSLVTLDLKQDSDLPFIEQLKQSVEKPNNVLIVNNLLLLLSFVDKSKTETVYNFLQELNFAREELIALNVPILFWINDEVLGLLSNRAADLYRQRSINTLHFDSIAEDTDLNSGLATRFTEEFRSSEEYEVLELKLRLQKQQLKDAEKNSYPISKIANSLVLPLAQTYSEIDLHQEAIDLIDKYEIHIDTSQYAKTENLAEILFAANKYEKAILYYKKALKLSVGNIYSQAYTYSQLADIYYEIGKYDQSKVAIEKSAKLYKNVDDKYNLSVAYERIGRLYQSLGNLDKALQFFELDIELTKELYTSNPKNESIKNSLAISYDLQFFELDNELKKELYSSNPKNESIRNGLAISYGKLGDIHKSLGNLDKALQFFELEIDLFKELYTSNPKNESIKNGLAISYEKLGDIHQSLGNLDKALQFFELEIDLFKELYSSNPKNESIKNGLAISYSNLGDIHQSLGNLDKALWFFELDIELTKELYTSNPKNESIKNGLAVSYYKLGEIYLYLNRENDAKHYFISCQTLFNELFKSNPLSIQNKSNYAEILAISSILDIQTEAKNKLNFSNLERAITFWTELYEKTKSDYYTKKISIVEQFQTNKIDYKTAINQLLSE